MKFTWRSRKEEVAGEIAGRRYASETVVNSRVLPGVRFTIAKMSFGRRVELMRQVRELAQRKEFLAASQEAGERMSAAVLQAEIDRLFMTWGLTAVSGLTVDGKMASPELLAEAGPEELFREALAAVRRETGLSEEERKNS